MKKAEFSFIIPTLNEGKYIEGCIKSIKRNNGSYEIIVVDSYSKDSTVKIARRHKCKVFFEGRKGPGVARNTGARHVKGKILIFSDADARFDKDFLKRLKKSFSGYGGCVFRQGLFDADGRGDLFFLNVWNTLIRTVNNLGFTMTNGVCFVYNKKVFREFHGFDPKLLTNEDHDLARRVSKKYRFVFMNDIVVRTSKRRAKKMGMMKFFMLQIKATLTYFLNHRSVSEYWSQGFV